MGLLFRNLFDTRFISFPLTLYVVHSVGCSDPVRREQAVLLMATENVWSTTKTIDLMYQMHLLRL